jgi:hypothetical protein
MNKYKEGVASLKPPIVKLPSQSKFVWLPSLFYNIMKYLLKQNEEMPSNK